MLLGDGTQVPALRKLFNILRLFYDCRFLYFHLFSFLFCWKWLPNQNPAHNTTNITCTIERNTEEVTRTAKIWRLVFFRVRHVSKNKNPIATIHKTLYIERWLHTSAHSPIFHCGHCPRLQLSRSTGLDPVSQAELFPVSPAHSTKRSLTPSPQEAEHCNLSYRETNILE